MARWALALAFVLAAATAAVAAAYPSALRIPRREPGQAAAIPEALFSHRTHGAFGCYSCHPSTFPQSAFGFTHEDMSKGRFCGRCHDGRVGFAIAGTACARCHVPR
jgi:c(7)-type cytochrome triheme protein